MDTLRRDAAEKLPSEGEIVLAGWQGPTSSHMHKQIARRRNNAWEAFLLGFWYEPEDPDYWWPIVVMGRTPYDLANLVAADNMEALLGEASA